MPLYLKVTSVETGVFLLFGGIFLTTLLGWFKMPFLHTLLETVAGGARAGGAVRFSTTPSGCALQYLSHRILFDTQEATWGEEIHSFPLTYHCALSINAFFFPLILHHALIGRAPQTGGHWTHSVACMEDLQGNGIHCWSGCDTSAPYCCRRTVDLQHESTWVALILNDPICSGSDLK